MIGHVAYKLALPPKCGIHDVFHVEFLMKFTSTLPIIVPQLPPIKHPKIGMCRIRNQIDGD
jgi:hypothetical protein